VSSPLDARTVALNPPRVHGAPVAPALLRAEPEDFVVEEELGFAPAGNGAHVLLKVRKRNANTAWVAAQLARHAGCRPTDAGFAGLKDRRAVAVQWFSVPRPRAAARDWQGVSGEGFEVLEAHAHNRKLPRGALAGNRFSIRLRAPDADGASLAAHLAPRLRELEAHGVPNYFGSQRFGRDGSNLGYDVAALAGLGRAQRGFALSAARSVIFNAVLARRVEQGSWNRLLPGELANLDGRGSIFATESADAALPARLARQEIHPTGPLWGRGDPKAQGEALALELQVAAAFATECELCAAVGMEHERRSLRLRVAALEWTAEPDGVVLRFQLPRGAFATAVLRELVDVPATADSLD
jgi:tRNA pseudouridine13 synthase